MDVFEYLTKNLADELQRGFGDVLGVLLPFQVAGRRLGRSSCYGGCECSGHSNGHATRERAWSAFVRYRAVAAIDVFALGNHIGPGPTESRD